MRRSNLGSSLLGLLQSPYHVSLRTQNDIENLVYRGFQETERKVIRFLFHFSFATKSLGWHSVKNTLLLEPCDVTQSSLLMYLGRYAMTWQPFHGQGHHCPSWRPRGCGDWSQCGNSWFEIRVLSTLWELGHSSAGGLDPQRIPWV